MPFIKEGNTTQLLFGQGDIAISPGWLVNDRTTSVVCFQPLDIPTPIGTKTDNVAGTHLTVEEAPLRMLFTDPASIDVLINALHQAKIYMTTDE